MMFNGLMMCGDSDTSDFTKESVGASSGAGSGANSGAGSGAGGGACWDADYYHNKLLSTQQVLQNKEETVRVQGESLRVAEARIARLQRQLDAKAQQERRRAVRALETNLAITEDLYRECFYETAKQEELIETLRKSYLEAKEPYAPPQQPRKPFSARDQDIAMEVDSLKLEMTNYLNNSNNDSVK